MIHLVKNRKKVASFKHESVKYTNYIRTIGRRSIKFLFTRS